MSDHARRSGLMALCAVTVLTACAGNTPLPQIHGILAATADMRHFDHFVLIMLENEDAANVNAIPYMDSLAHRGVWLRNYYAVAHPSYPNYLALISGQTFVESSPHARHDPVAYSRRDFGDAQLLIDAPTIIDRFEARKLSWDAFAEDYPDSSRSPRNCDFRRSAGLYSRKHFPFVSFRQFHSHPKWCAHVRNLKWFRPDSLAAYTFIAPNMVNDGHDAPLSTAAVWLRGFLEPILADTMAMKSTMIVVTFDEASSSLSQALTRSWPPNVVYTVLLGPAVRAGESSGTPYNHFNLLRTLETNFDLTPSLLPDGVVPIEGMWR